MEFLTLFNVLAVLGGLFAIVTFFSGLYTIEQQQLAVVERFGKFVRTANPGLNFKLPYVEKVYKLDSRVTQLDVEVETKTQDNVFLSMKISVQYTITDAVKALYKLKDAHAQISSYVFDVVRAQVPKLTLDQSFERKNDIATAIKAELSESMTGFGYGILQALVTDINPDSKVKAAMNEINANARLREAATQKAEADKIILVKKAEAEAESKALQGKGIANERKAIMDGLKESIETFQGAVQGSSTEEIMSLMLMTQYFDTLKSLGNEGTRTILLPGNPGAVGDFQNQIIGALQTTPTSETGLKAVKGSRS